jgi:hypothetical protein
VSLLSAILVFVVGLVSGTVIRTFAGLPFGLDASRVTDDE